MNKTTEKIHDIDSRLYALADDLKALEIMTRGAVLSIDDDTDLMTDSEIHDSVTVEQLKRAYSVLRVASLNLETLSQQIRQNAHELDKAMIETE